MILNSLNDAFMLNSIIDYGINIINPVFYESLVHNTHINFICYSPKLSNMA